jgi:hypothetical protein
MAVLAQSSKRLALGWLIAALAITQTLAQDCRGVLVAVGASGQRCLVPGAGERFKDCAECPEMIVCRPEASRWARPRMSSSGPQSARTRFA